MKKKADDFFGIRDDDPPGQVPDRYLTAKQVAEKLGVSTSWILRKAKSGIAPHIRIGGVIRFSQRDVEAWVQAHKIKGTLKV